LHSLIVILAILFRVVIVWALSLYTITTLWLPYTCLLGTSLVSDLNSRLNTNDPHIKSFYFWWTSTTYLASFLWLIYICIYLSLTSRRLYFSFIGIYVLSLLLNTEINDFLILNKGWEQSTYAFIGSNELLTNALNCYHPGMLYTSFFLLTSSLTVHHDMSFLTKHYAYSGYTYLNHRFSQVFTTLSLSSLMLGSWWALQEGTWGGWWNWDTSEVLGLLIALYFFILLHSFANYASFIIFRYKQLLLWINIVTMYTLVQISFELTAHNFGIKFFYFFNNNLLLLECFTVLLLLSNYFVILLLRYKRAITLRWKTECCGDTYYSSFRIANRLIFVLSVLLLIIFSTKPLLNYLTWTFLLVNSSIGLATNFTLTFTILFYIMSLLMRSYPFNWTILSFYILNSCTWPWPILLQFKTLRTVYLMHWLLFSFFLINWSLLSYDFNYWCTNTLKQSVLDFKSISILKSWVLALDSNTIELIALNYKVNNASTENWVLLTTTNASTLNLFSLEMMHSELYNYYQLSETYLTTILCVNLPFTAYLATLFYILLLTYVMSQRTNWTLS